MTQKRQEHLTRQETVERFRARLAKVIERSGLARSAFAAKVGIDRSTLSQILSDNNDRLPRVETLSAIAATEQVSLDWLVGLSDEGALGTSTMEISRGLSSPSDERLERWYSEFIGYKIRHVPATLPDALKTDAVIEHEYESAARASPEQRRVATQRSLAYQRRTESDTEVCTSMQMIETFTRGEGIWAALSVETRREQLQHFARLTGELYPGLRWFLFDGLNLFSVPLTIFGARRAVVYVGQAFLVFNGLEHIRMLSNHFDDLIRGAVVQAHVVSSFLADQSEKVI